jgi:acyl carrier protein
MELQEFLRDFESQFEEVKPDTVTADTELESLDEWNSVQALVIMAMIDSKYGRKISGADINKARTVGDIFSLLDQNS